MRRIRPQMVLKAWYPPQTRMGVGFWSRTKGRSKQKKVMHYQLGQAAAQAAEQLGRRIAWVASGDLAHCQKQDGPYGYQPEGPEYDARIMDTMGRGAFGELLEYDENFCQKAMECGHRSFVMMAGALDRTDVTPHVPFAKQPER